MDPAIHFFHDFWWKSMLNFHTYLIVLQQDDLAMGKSFLDFLKLRTKILKCEEPSTGLAPREGMLLEISLPSRSYHLNDFNFRIQGETALICDLYSKAKAVTNVTKKFKVGNLNEFY